MQLRKARQDAGLSVREVESRTGISKTIICNTETGKTNTTIDTITTLAAEYGLAVRIE